MTGFVELIPETYSYLADESNSDEKVKETKKYKLKRILKFSDYKKCLLNNEIILKAQQKVINNV